MKLPCRKKERVTGRETGLGTLGMISKMDIVVSMTATWRKVSAFPPVNPLVHRAFHKLSILFQICHC